MTDKEIAKAFEVLDSWQQVALHNDDGTDKESPKLYKAIKIVKKEYNRQKADNEILQDLMVKNDATIAKQEVEIERLSVLANLANMRANDYRSMRDKCKTAKAEAIKEFAERLKEKAKPHYFDNCCFAVSVEVIDNLAKEMVGDVG